MIKAVPINDASMVLSFSVDMGETENFLVSAEILIPNTSMQNTSYASMVVEAEGKTIKCAFNKISKLTGQTIVLTHNDVIVLGEEIIKQGKIYSSISYVVGHSYLSDNAYVFCCKGMARDVIKYTSAIGHSPGHQLMQIVGRNRFDDINTITLKNVLLKYHELGQTIVLPQIVPIETNTPQGADEKTAPDEEKAEYLYDITQSMVTKGTEYIFTTSGMQSIQIRYLNGEIKYGGLCVIGENNEAINLHIVNKKLTKKFDKNSNTITAKLEFELMIKEINNFADTSVDVDRSLMTDTEEKNLKESIKKDLEDFYKFSQFLDVDVYSFRQMFFSKFGKDLPIQDIKLNVEVDVKYV